MTEPKKMGRPPFPEDKRRTARLSMRTFPEIAGKAKKLGTPAVEELIRNAKVKTRKEPK